MDLDEHRLHRRDLPHFAPELGSHDLTAVRKIWHHYNRIFVYINNDDSSRLFAIGNNTQGLLGIGHDRLVDKPKELIQFRNQTIEEIVFGQKHCLLLNFLGDLYGWGSNSHNQIGLDMDKVSSEEDFKYTFCPVKIYQEGENYRSERIIKIAAGFQHSVALKNTGKVLIWGANLFGRLGLGIDDDNDVPVPTEIDLLDGIVRIEVMLWCDQFLFWY